MTRFTSKGLALGLAYHLAGCDPDPPQASGCAAYVQALESCLADMAVPVDPGLQQRVACHDQPQSVESDALYQCMADTINRGSCVLDDREDPLLHLARSGAACHPRQLKEGLD
jgi:hypothetical protein